MGPGVRNDHIWIAGQRDGRSVMSTMLPMRIGGLFLNRSIRKTHHQQQQKEPTPSRERGRPVFWRYTVHRDRKMVRNGDEPTLVVEVSLMNSFFGGY